MSKTVIFERDFCVREVEVRFGRGKSSGRVNLAEFDIAPGGWRDPGSASIMSSSLDIDAVREHLGKRLRLFLEVVEELKPAVGRRVHWVGDAVPGAPGGDDGIVTAIDEALGVCAVFVPWIGRDGETRIVKLDDIYKVERDPGERGA